MKVIAHVTGNCAAFTDGKEYNCYTFFIRDPYVGVLCDNGIIVIDNDGDAMKLNDAEEVFNVSFELIF